MKNLFLSMLAMVAMVSCTNEIVDNGDGKEVDNGQPVPIRMIAGVVGVETKAPIITGTTNFTPGIAGWEATDAPSSLATDAIWSTTATPFTVTAAAASITLIKTPYYSTDGTKNTYVIGFYPTGTITNGVLAVADNLKADKDLMVTGLEDAGNRGDTKTVVLQFNHITSQIKFVVKSSDTSFPATDDIAKIELKEVGIPNGINLFEKTASYGAASLLTLPGTMPTDELTAVAVAAGDAVMVKPFEENALKLNITTTNGGSYSDVAVTLAAMTTGTAYTITLDFKAKEVKATAAVTEWVENSTGTGTIE